MKKRGMLHYTIFLFALLLILGLTGVVFAGINSITVTTPAAGANLSSSSFPLVINVTPSYTINANVTNMNATYRAPGGAWTNACANSSVVDTNLTDYTCSWSLPTLNGTYELNVTLFENTSKVANATVFNLTIDTIFPTVSSLSPSNMNTTINNLSVGFLCQDLFNLSACELFFYADGAGGVNQTNRSIHSTSQVTVNKSFTGLADGIYTFRAEANDTLGNKNTSAANITVGIDTTSPAYNASYFLTNNISTYNPAGNTWIQFNSSWNDTTLEVEVISLWINSSSTPVNTTVGAVTENSPVELTYLLPSNAAGDYLLWMSANDTVGNSANTTLITVSVNDTLQPAVNLNSPVEWYNTSATSITFNFTATDNFYTTLNCSININGSVNLSNFVVSVGTPSINTTSGFNDGDYLWNATCEDSAANSNTSLSRIFTVDTVPLDVAPLMTLQDSDDDGNVNLTWNAISGAKEYGVFRSTSNITDATNATRVANVTGTFFTDNTTSHGLTYWYVMTAIDRSGNENLSLVNFTIGQNNGTTNDTITPRNPTSINVTNSSNVATITWPEVTLDNSGNPDFTGLRYEVWTKSGGIINTSQNLTANGFAVISNSNVTTNTTTYTITSSNCASSPCNRMFAVTSHDDAGNKNISYNVTASDVNFINVSLTFTESSSDDSSSSSSSSGSSGSGTVPPSADDGTFAEVSRQWSAISKDEETTFAVNKDKIAVQSVVFKTTDTYTNVGMDVKSLAKPSSVSAPSNEVFQYLEIDTSNLPDSGIASATIEFKVPFSWFNENNVKRNTVKLLRYTTKWVELDTKEVRTDSSSAYFEATTPGFSFFVITGEKTEEEAEDTSEDSGEDTVEDEETPQEETTEEVADDEDAQRGAGSWLKWLFLILVIIGVVVYFVFASIKKKQGGSA